MQKTQESETTRDGRADLGCHQGGSLIITALVHELRCILILLSVTTFNASWQQEEDGEGGRLFVLLLKE